MIKAIIFDFDGVLVDSEPLHYRAFLRTAKEAGIEIDFSYDEYLEKYVGFDDREGFREMLTSVNAAAVMAPDFVKQIEALCQRKKEVFAAIVEEGFEPVPGALEFVGGLPPAFPAAIASGATRADIDLILGRLGIAPRFNPIISADDVPRSKPDPATYRLAFQSVSQRIGGPLQPAEVVAIEDTAPGIESARGAGLMTLGITTTGDTATLRQAHRVINGFAGLTLEKLQLWFDDQ